MTPYRSKLSNADVEERTWQWFMGAVSRRFGPAYYASAHHPVSENWPDIIAKRAKATICFEITSPLRPDDVNSHKTDDEEQPFLLHQRILEATARKIERYGARAIAEPIALLITLAHPATLRLTRGNTSLPGIAEELQMSLAQELEQPFDAIYLVGPGENAQLLWRRSGSKWKRIFPELDAIQTEKV